jgi:hypothetical protein
VDAFYLPAISGHKKMVQQFGDGDDGIGVYHIPYFFASVNALNF